MIASSNSKLSAAISIFLCSSIIRFGISALGICFVEMISISFALIGFIIVFGVILCFLLNAVWISLLLFVSFNTLLRMRLCFLLLGRLFESEIYRFSKILPCRRLVFQQSRPQEYLFLP